MTNVVIVAAGRTAVGSFNGAFANTPAHDLGASVLEGVIARAVPDDPAGQGHAERGDGAPVRVI